MTDHTTDIPLKRCSKCGEEKPATAEYFRPRTDQNGRLRGVCRECLHERRVKYYQDHHEEALENARQWELKHPEQKRETARKWRQANREHVNAKSNQWQKDNRDKVREMARRWRHANPERVKATRKRWRDANLEQDREKVRRSYRKHRAKRLAEDRAYREANKEKRAEQFKKWAKDNRAKLRAKDNRRRAWKRQAQGAYTADDIQRQYDAQKGRCWWCNCKLDDAYHADHLIPLARGGSNAPENIVIACPHCNQSKGAKLPHEWCGRLF